MNKQVLLSSLFLVIVQIHFTYAEKYAKHQVSLQILNSVPINKFCEGSIIRNDFIVTPAHCFFRYV